MDNQQPRTAAFVRVEGVLLRRGVLAASAYLASSKPGLGERLLALGQVALAAPAYAVLGQNDRTFANRLAFLSCRKMSQDRIQCLAEEYYEDILKDKILARGVEILERAHEAGHRVVLLSEGLADYMQPLARQLRHVDELVCNHLEFVQGACTGKLLDPVIGGHNGGAWAQQYAARHNLDLARSTAYGAHGPDITLLAAVGKPCAVNPDYTLRSAAREADWPVVEYGG